MSTRNVAQEAAAARKTMVDLAVAADLRSKQIRQELGGLDSQTQRLDEEREQVLRGSAVALQSINDDKGQLDDQRVNLHEELMQLDPDHRPSRASAPQTQPAASQQQAPVYQPPAQQVPPPGSNPPPNPPWSNANPCDQTGPMERVADSRHPQCAQPPAERTPRRNSADPRNWGLIAGLLAVLGAIIGWRIWADNRTSILHSWWGFDRGALSLVIFVGLVLLFGALFGAIGDLIVSLVRRHNRRQY